MQTFQIPEQKISVPFLMVGHVSEPRIMFDRPAISFGQCLIGGARGHATVMLINSEDLPFTFAFDKSSYDASDQQLASTGQRAVVEFEPSSGTIPPQGSITLQATFSPHEERSYNYNVMCKVAKKPTRLTLNVKGEGYAIHESLVLESLDGSSTPLAPRSVNLVDFGQVSPDVG